MKKMNLNQLRILKRAHCFLGWKVWLTVGPPCTSPKKTSSPSKSHFSGPKDGSRLANW
ncbi:hypothetical protein RSAG8_09363, partial [Rhizoctonia solani AG-8 WAC10335]